MSQLSWQGGQSAPADWTLVRNVVPDETHESMAWPSVYPGIKALYARYSTVANPSVSPMVRLGEFAARIPMDESMPPPRILLRQLVEDQLVAVNATTARSALDRLAVAYGENDDVRALRQEIAALDGTQIEGPPVEELLATPRASTEAIQALAGEWRGYTQMEGATGRSLLTLTVWLEDSIPVGEFGMAQGPGHVIEYITTDDDQFRVGYMNGMRPRGMLVYEGTIENGVFAGEFLLRGVVFRMPDGSELPRVRFNLERVGP